MNKYQRINYGKNHKRKIQLRFLLQNPELNFKQYKWNNKSYLRDKNCKNWSNQQRLRNRLRVLRLINTKNYVFINYKNEFNT